MISKRIEGKNLETVAWEEETVPELRWLVKRQRKEFILICVQNGCLGCTKRQLFSHIFRTLLQKGKGSRNGKSQARLEKEIRDEGQTRAKGRMCSKGKEVRGGEGGLSKITDVEGRTSKAEEKKKEATPQSHGRGR